MRFRAAAACLGAALLSRTAAAHLVTTGLGPTYDGIGHFALSAEDIFPVIALALFAGLRGPAQARLIVFALPPAWLIGGLIGGALHFTPSPLAEQVGSAIVFLAVGLILATNLRLPAALTAAAATLLGLARGALEGASFDQGALLEVLLGTAIATFVTAALAVSVALTLKRFWMIIAMRVAGSWLAALGLLLMGWSIHTHTGG